MMGLGLALLILLALGGAEGKAAPPPKVGPLPPEPDPNKPSMETTGKSGTKWITQNATPPEASPAMIDVFIVGGQHGVKKTSAVLRFQQALVSGAPRTLVETASGMKSEVIALAKSDFGIGEAKPDKKKAEEELPVMPVELREKLAKALEALTVAPDGTITGPVTPEAIQLATSVAGELSRAGFSASAAVLREYIQAAGKLVADPDDNKKIPLPDELPKDIQDMIQRAIYLEKDPEKLREIVRALEDYKKKLPADRVVSHQRLADAIEIIRALIVQIEAANEYKKTIDDIKNKIHADDDPDPVPPPPPPPPPTPVQRTYTVQAGDSARRIAYRFTGDENRASELDRANPTKKPLPTKGVWTGEVLNLPDSWPAEPKHAPPKPTEPTGRTFTVYQGHKGPWQLANDLTGSGARWKELIAVNPKKKVTKDAQGKVTGFATWYAGEVINLPASWPEKPPAPSPAPTPPEEPKVVPPAPSPQPAPEPKTPVEISADALAKHLWDIQRTHGMPGAKGKEDSTLIREFQTLAGDPAPDGNAGPGTLARMAVAGVSNLPLVMKWPKSATSANVLKYREDIRKIARDARAAGKTERADALEASALRERGQGGIADPQNPVLNA